MAEKTLKRGKPRKYTQDQAQFCSDLRVQGYSWGKIAELTGIPVGSCRVLERLAPNQNPRPPEGKAGDQMLNHADDSTARRGANPEDGGPK